MEQSAAHDMSIHVICVHQLRMCLYQLHRYILVCMVCACVCACVCVRVRACARASAAHDMNWYPCCACVSATYVSPSAT